MPLQAFVVAKNQINKNQIKNDYVIKLTDCISCILTTLLIVYIL